MEKDVIKGMIHCKIFLSKHFMKYSFRAISWTMKYFYFSSQCQYKNCVYREKISSDSENLITLILIDLLLKTKTRKSKRPNVSEWNHGWKTGTTKKHVLAYFQNFCWLTNSNMIFEWMLHHTIDHTMIFIYWLLFAFYITYTYSNTVCID